MEVWKQINGYPNYEVSNLGRIKSIARIVYRSGNACYLKECIKKLKIEWTGYVTVQLYYAPKKSKTYRLHRIVAIHFIDNADNKPDINHKNCIKTDNRVENLEWCTKSENIQHAYENGLYDGIISGEDHYLTKIKESDVLKIRELGEQNIPHREIALMFPVCRETVGNIIRRKTWKHI